MLEVFTEVLDYSILLGCLIAVVSGIVQGYSGFGGGLIIVPALAILFSPLEAISVTVVAAFLGNAMLIPDAMKKAHWPEAIPVAIALAVSTLLGLSFLVSADPKIIKIGMGVFVLAAALLLMSGWTYKGARGWAPSIISGGLAGGVTGGFGMPGGPFLVVYFLSAPVPPPVQRANLIVTIAIAILFLFGGLVADGVYTPDTIARSILIVPAFMTGTWIGRHIFKIAPAKWFTKVAYGLLLATGISVLMV